jgi:hypothetical protein
MFIAYAVIAIALSVALVASGATKQPRVVEGIVGRVGSPLSSFPALASAEIAGAVGLIMAVKRSHLRKDAGPVRGCLLTSSAKSGRHPIRGECQPTG